MAAVGDRDGASHARNLECKDRAVDGGPDPQLSDSVTSPAPDGPVALERAGVRITRRHRDGSLIENTATGSGESVIVPSPSCPEELYPQH